MKRSQLLCLAVPGLLLAQAALAEPGAPVAASPPAVQGQPATQTPAADPGLSQARTILSLTASYGGGGNIPSGLNWRVFLERPEADGVRAMVAESKDRSPTFLLPEGDYVVHVSWGLAAATRRVTVRQTPMAEKIQVNAGALRIVGMLGDTVISPNRETIAVYVPQPGNSEAKLVVQQARPGALLGLPEGTYHLVSTYLDTVGVGSLNQTANSPTPTNSVVTADVRVQTGKLTETTLRHRAAVMTLKLVNTSGGEALANTSFTILTPGGDVIRELIGAFPSLVLAEGDYVVIARHTGKTWQANFTVQSTLDRDVEVIAQ